MSYLPDRVVAHLARSASEPDLQGTPYQFGEEIGRGGMGVVYRVTDTRLRRDVALKVLHTGAELIEEARVVAGLEHAGIVPIYDTGALADGRPYYTMKLVRGKSLNRYVTDRTPLSERLRLFLRVCEAAAFAHSRGVVHRDLKPQNIMVGQFGEVLVLDWGVARHPETLETPGMVVGTPQFMAPELAGGRSDGSDHRADIYSLGALLTFCLSAQAPKPLRAIARKAMSVRPEDRYRDAEAMAAEISRYQDGLPVEAYRETPPERLLRWAARERTLLLLLAAYAGVRFLLFFLRRL